MDKYRMEVEREKERERGYRGEDTGTHKKNRRIPIRIKVAVLVIVMLVVGVAFKMKDIVAGMKYTFAENMGIIVVGAIIIAIGLILKFISEKTGCNFNDKKYFKAPMGQDSSTDFTTPNDDLWGKL